VPNLPRVKRCLKCNEKHRRRESKRRASKMRFEPKPERIAVPGFYFREWPGGYVDVGHYHAGETVDTPLRIAGPIPIPKR
jgi:hypothetical protein